MVQELSRHGRRPKTVCITYNRIAITYVETVERQKPKRICGTDMNALNNTYAGSDGSMRVIKRLQPKWYNKAHSYMCRVKRRDDNRIIKKFQDKAWRQYHNRTTDAMRKEANRIASLGFGVVFEFLTIHRLYTKNQRITPYMRGLLKTTLSTGKMRRLLIAALDKRGLPHWAVDPSGTSSQCHVCRGKLKRASHHTRTERNMWCQTCKRFCERDENAAINILQNIMSICLGDKLEHAVDRGP